LLSPRELEDCSRLLTGVTRITIDDGGDTITFISYNKEFGLIKGILSGKDIDVYGVVHSAGRLKNIVFYIDKKLKWEYKDQGFLPGMAPDRTWTLEE